MTNLVTATANDFKVGTTLFTQYGYSFTITRFYSEGVWEAKNENGEKCVYESEAMIYKVKK